MTMRKLVALVLVIVVAAVAAVVFAGEGPSETKGKYYFKKQCKSCHVAGQPGKVVTPLNKTQAQWKAYFAADKHKNGTEKIGAGLPLKPEQIKDIEAFLIAHASDSPQPMTCGD